MRSAAPPWHVSPVPPSPFDRACELARVGADTFEGRLDEGWYQGRGVYGGLVAALAIHALEARFDKPVRSLTISFLAPAVAGPLRVEIATEREGRSVVTAIARLYAGEQPMATALATLAEPRRPRLAHHAGPRPTMPAPDAVPDGPEALYLPVFCQHLELRQAVGAAPFSGGEAAHLAGWCRMREPSRPSAALAAALLDAWPPAALVTSDTWRAAASVDMSIQTLGALPDDAEGHWAFEARARWVDDGYADELATLWAPDGTPVAVARQLVAIFG